jgi:hypothetical protein
METPEPGDTQDQPQIAAQPEQPVKRGRGRPRIWPKERRIELVKEGRMSFQPGVEHQMDVQFDEARQLRETIGTELANVQALMVELSALDDPSVAISHEEEEITKLLWALYGRRKHREHMLATFLVARRRRQLQRLRAASAALAQARDFLLADAGMLPRLQQTIADAQTQALALHGPPPQPKEAEVDEEDVPVVPTEDLDAEERRTDLLKATGGGDDAKNTRAALAELEERTRTMRSAIVQGNGRFEWFYIPIPKDDPEDEEQRYWGPYLRFLWNEGKIRYQLGMGHIKRFDPTQSDKPPIF